MRSYAVLILPFSFAALATVSCSRPTSDDLFVWNRPRYPLSNLPISKSATCSFKKGLSVGFHKRFPLSDDSKESEQVYYSASEENEADTVAFVDLDTDAPKVQSNNGQGSLKVLYKDGRMLTLIHTSASGDTEMYTIFLDKGVLILSQHQDATVIGPFGVTEMGYCN